MKSKLFKSTYYGWIICFVIVPLILVLIQSFLDSDYNFTLQNYQTFFSSVYIEMTFNSFVYAGLITIISLLIAYPLAYIVAFSKMRKLLLILIILPSWINLLLKTYAFMSLLGEGGIISQLLLGKNLLFTPTGFLIVATYIYVPFMVLPIYNAITNIPKNYIYAASDLGATKLDILRKVIFPLSKKGVYAGIQITFIPSLSIFMITRLIAGNRIITLGTAIEQHFLVTGNWGLGSAIGTVLIVFLLASIYLMEKFNKKSLKAQGPVIETLGGINDEIS